MTERTFYRAIIIVLIFFIVATIGIVAIDELWNVEIECYSTKMEITHCESTSYYVRNEGAQTKCTFYLSNGTKAIAIDVDQQTYARYSEGDSIQVKIQVMECPITHTIKECATIIKNLP